MKYLELFALITFYALILAVPLSIAQECFSEWRFERKFRKMIE